jgi:hypothetical protein
MAATRAATAMLRALGGAEIFLLLPQVGMPDDPSAQLGLVDPGIEQVRLAPVVVRNLPTQANGPRRRVEFLVPAGAVADELAARGVASAQVLLDGALGILHNGEVFHVEDVCGECFAGTTYLYRVTAVE